MTKKTRPEIVTDFLHIDYHSDLAPEPVRTARATLMEIEVLRRKATNDLETSTDLIPAEKAAWQTAMDTWVSGGQKGPTPTKAGIEVAEAKLRIATSAVTTTKADREKAIATLADELYDTDQRTTWNDNIRPDLEAARAVLLEALDAVTLAGSSFASLLQAEEWTAREPTSNVSTPSFYGLLLPAYDLARTPAWEAPTPAPVLLGRFVN